MDKKTLFMQYVEKKKRLLSSEKSFFRLRNRTLTNMEKAVHAEFIREVGRD